MSEPSFWEGLYRSRDDGWELGGPSPPLVDLLERDPPAPREGKVAIVGCGRGHDARLFARKGYAAWGFDFSPYAIEQARRLASGDGVRVSFERRDVFSLPGDYPNFFDIVWEYTCYCAIDPGRRDEYLDALHRILAPGGTLLGLFYPIREGTGGPPFPTTEQDLRERLEKRFEILSVEVPSNSVPRRQDKERLVHAKK